MAHSALSVGRTTRLGHLSRLVTPTRIHVGGAEPFYAAALQPQCYLNLAVAPAFPSSRWPTSVRASLCVEELTHYGQMDRATFETPDDYGVRRLGIGHNLL